MVSMLVAALVVGAITAYYFGLRPGMIAAALSGVLFAFGFVVPSKMLWAYGLVGAYTLGVLVVGPRLPGREKNKRDLLGVARKGAGRVYKFYRDLRR
jgi:hypothetical protein